MVKNGRNPSKVIKQLTFIPVEKDLCSQTFTTLNYCHTCVFNSSVHYHIPGHLKKNPDLVPNSGPFLALWSGSGPSPEFRTIVVPLQNGCKVPQVIFYNRIGCDIAHWTLSTYKNSPSYEFQPVVTSPLAETKFNSCSGRSQQNEP